MNGDYPEWFWANPAVMVRMVAHRRTQASRRDRGQPEIPVRYAGFRHLPRVGDTLQIGNECWTVTAVNQTGVWADDSAAQVGVPTVVGTVGIDGPVSDAGMI